MNDWFLYCVKIAVIVGTGFVVGVTARKAWTEICKWWRSGQWEPPATIRYRKLRRGICEGKPCGVCGLHLVVAGENAQELVSAGEAVDREEFWRTWMHLGGQSKGWLDEEGNEVDLTA